MVRRKVRAELSSPPSEKSAVFLGVTATGASVSGKVASVFS